MNRLMVLAALTSWVGLTLLLAEWRRFSRPSLARRLAPFAGRSAPGKGPGGVLSVQSFGDVLVPVLAAGGARLSRLFGINESLDTRLRRIHSPLGVGPFRLRQFAWSGLGLLAGLAVAAAGAPLPASLLAVAGAPLLAFLVIEHRLVSAAARWQETLTRELPVVSEQLAMLLNAGYSVGAALSRLSRRGQGCCARDLTVVVNRIHQGVGEAQALREWTEIARVPSLDRLVSILALDSETSDLGRMVSAETRQARRDLQRTTTEIIERRNEQVWVPVTVATLVPGAILLAIPFLAALRLFAGA